MKPILLSAVLVLAAAACNKAEETPTVSGIITDDHTGKPIAGVPVHLIESGRQFGKFGYAGTEPPLRIDTTDAKGAYSIAMDGLAGGMYCVYPVNRDPYVRSSPIDGQDYSFSSGGSQVKNLSAFRVATAQVELHNTPPVAAAAFELIGPFEQVAINNQVHDTVINLRILGKRSITNVIHFSSGVPAPSNDRISTEPGGTVYLNYEF